MRTSAPPPSAERCPVDRSIDSCAVGGMMDGCGPTQPKRRLASVFRAQEGAKWCLDRANPPPFEATRLAPGQRPCRRPKTRFRLPVHTPAAWLGPIRPIAPSASGTPRHSIWAPEPEIGRNRQNGAGAGTVRSRPPGRVGRCSMALPRAPDLLSSFAWLTVACYPKRADLNGHIAAGVPITPAAGAPAAESEATRLAPR